MITGLAAGAKTTEQKYVYDAWNRLVQAYTGKTGGPLPDRIDIHLDVPAVPYR
jgi:hypothetical protein